MSTNLETAFTTIGRDMGQALRGRVASLLDFANNIPINNGLLHTLGDNYASQAAAESAFVGVPIAQAATLLGDWSGISVASCAAWAASLSGIAQINVPDGHYVMNLPLILRQERQRWICTPDDRQVFRYHDPKCQFEYVGSGDVFRTVMTRRLYRGLISDPNDETMVACVQIENNGIRFMPTVVIEYNEAWGAANPDDLIGGDPDWDIGIFVGCRVEVSLMHAGVLGHHKVANLYVDVTRSAALSELVGWDGVTHLATRESGADGLCLDYTSFSGGRWRVVMLGAQFKAGLSSYGKDYTEYLNITFTAQPAELETITLGEKVFVFGNTAPFGQFAVPLGATKEDTALNLSTIARDVSELQDSASPKIGSAAFIASENVITAVDNSNSTYDFTAFTAATTSASIMLSGAGISVQADPALYYDQILGAVADGRGGYGASDVTAYRMFTTESEWLEGRRVWEDIRSDMNYLIEGVSAGAMWLDVAAGNSSRRAWGQRYISCRFASYDPFIVRLGKIARITFLDCHTEPAESAIFDVAGVATSKRYGSYTNTPESLAINLEGANASPVAAYFALRDKGSNVNRPQGGRTEMGGQLTVKQGLKVGGGSQLEDPATVQLSGGAYQEILLGDATATKRGRIRHQTSDGSMAFYCSGTDSVTAYRAMRLKYGSSLSTWDVSGGLKVGSLDADSNFSAAQNARMTAGAGYTAKIFAGSVTVAEFAETYARFNQPIRPDTNASATATIGLSTTRYGKAWINDVRMTPPASVSLTGAGEAAFEYVSDTQLRLKMRGIDGTTRSITFTVA